ncbi:MAG: hypothetical protein M1820_007757 [Bogoriella megaspora]|nr:MAG: hypothetical protein M1820_007757 [Bogoriella megaspora]
MVRPDSYFEEDRPATPEYPDEGENDGTRASDVGRGPPYPIVEEHVVAKDESNIPAGMEYGPDEEEYYYDDDVP